MYILTSVCSAQHSKRWSKNAFSHFLIRKCKKGSIEGKMRQIEVKKWVLGACTRKLIKVWHWCMHHIQLYYCWRRILFWDHMILLVVITTISSVLHYCLPPMSGGQAGNSKWKSGTINSLQLISAPKVPNVWRNIPFQSDHHPFHFNLYLFSWSNDCNLVS